MCRLYLGTADAGRTEPPGLATLAEFGRNGFPAPPLVIIPKSSSPPSSRGLHSSAFRLNLSAFCGIEGGVRGCLGGVRASVKGFFGGIRGRLRYVLCQKRLRLS